MAKKQNTPQTHNIPPSSPKVAASVQPPGQASPKATNGVTAAPGFVQHNAQLFIMAGIALFTYLFYAGSLDNKFTNWDDLGYVLNNALIKDSSAEGIKRIFDTSSFVMGNYHPLTILTYAIEYSYQGLEPFIYHLDSLLLHIIASLTVYGFVKVLTGRNIAAAIASLLFALHPMHVESVAWMAGRKDILYGIFYMLSCSTYLWYLRNKGGKRWLWYAATILLFTLSLLSKSVAVTLPVVLILLDYVEHRKLSVQMLLDKLPHFALSLAFGLLSIRAQDKVGALGTLDVSFSWVERLSLGCYALCSYLWKAVVPVALTNFYSYPMKVNDALPDIYYIYPVLVIGMLLALWRFARHNRLVLFGVAFLVVNLLLLLQFIPVGGAVMSERYTYIPYAGLFLIAGWYVSQYFAVPDKKPIANIVLGISLAYCMVLGFAANQRTKVWYDSLSLWNDAINKNPDAPNGYFYLGQEYYNRFESALTAANRKNYGDSAAYNFNLSIQHKPNYTLPIICLGEYQRSTGQFDAAKKNYLKAISIGDKSAIESAYLGLGVIYSIAQKYDSARVAFQTALALKEPLPEGHSNYANFLQITGKTDSALIEYGVSITQNPDALIPYMNRAKIYMSLNKNAEALKDYERAATIKPENPEPYYMSAQCLARMGRKTEALQNANKAKEMGYTQIDPAFYQSLK